MGGVKTKALDRKQLENLEVTYIRSGLKRVVIVDDEDHIFIYVCMYIYQKYKYQKVVHKLFRSTLHRLCGLQYNVVGFPLREIEH